LSFTATALTSVWALHVAPSTVRTTVPWSVTASASWSSTATTALRFPTTPAVVFTVQLDPSAE
jgi:hypothetical protein